MVFAPSCRLFDEFHAKGDKCSSFGRDVAIGPGFVRVDNQSGVGSSAPDSCDAGKIVFASQLDLDERGLPGKLSRRGFHLFGPVERDSHGRNKGERRSKAGQLPERHASALRVQIPKSAIDSVAGSAGREQLLELDAIHIRRQFIDLGNATFGSLAIVIDRGSFAAS